jgi:hypothetical protein
VLQQRTATTAKHCQMEDPPQTFLSPVASPLAGKKLHRKLFKCVKKGALVRWGAPSLRPCHWQCVCAVEGVAPHLRPLMCRSMHSCGGEMPPARRQGSCEGPAKEGEGVGSASGSPRCCVCVSVVSVSVARSRPPSLPLVVVQSTAMRTVDLASLGCFCCCCCVCARAMVASAWS